MTQLLFIHAPKATKKLIYAMDSRSIILVVDAGSSSVRCTTYYYESLDARSGRAEEDEVPPPTIQAIEGMHHSVPMMCVAPNTGYVRIHEVLDAIDLSIDKVLRLLREIMSEENYNIIALGFSTFVMNLIGVDSSGIPVGDATMSYACNRADVLDTCSRIKSEMGQDALQSLYQSTGALF